MSAIPNKISAPDSLSPISGEAFETTIHYWVEAGALSENRAEAAVRIMEAHRDGAPILNLDDLALFELPTEIGLLTTLVALHVSRNRLFELPDSIGSLEQLRVLYADQNNLGHLPESLGRLRKLQVLNIHQNKIRRLPGSFAALKQLSLFWVRGNPLESLPEGLSSLPASALADLSALVMRHETKTAADIWRKLQAPTPGVGPLSEGLRASLERRLSL